jgi:hypothetical protein
MGLTIRVRFGLVSGLPNEKIPVISATEADGDKKQMVLVIESYSKL